MKLAVELAYGDELIDAPLYGPFAQATGFVCERLDRGPCSLAVVAGVAGNGHEYKPIVAHRLRALKD